MALLSFKVGRHSAGRGRALLRKTTAAAAEAMMLAIRTAVVTLSNRDGSV
jgi:hypothetical protein